MASNIDFESNQISLRRRAQIGSIGGLVGGFAIFLIIFAIDAHLGLNQGTFYKVVGIPVGLGETTATIFGLLLHMLTAALIGTVFFFCSGIHKKLEINSMQKGALAGGVTGVVVYLIFFLPITVLIITPILESSAMDTEGIISTVTNYDSTKLLQNMDLILIGSLEIHIVFGLIMGTFCSMVKKMENERIIGKSGKNKIIKTVFLGIILATTVIALFYSISPTVTNPTLQKSQLLTSLNEIEQGLTFDKFSKLDESEQIRIVQKMSSNTILLMLEEAKKQDKVVNEDMSEIIALSNSFDDIKRENTAQIQGLKGNFAKGKAVIISVKDKSFLRLEEFSMTNGPSLHVYFTKSGDVENGINVGQLKGNVGEQNYDISGIDTKQYSVIVIYSKPFDRYFTSANLLQKSI